MLGFGLRQQPEAACLAFLDSRGGPFCVLGTLIRAHCNTPHPTCNQPKRVPSITGPPHDKGHTHIFRACGSGGKRWRWDLGGEGVATLQETDALRLEPLGSKHLA